jgi:hypothetical protein
VKMPLFMILDLAWGFPQEKRWDWAQFQLLAGWPRRGDLGRLGEPSAKKYEERRNNRGAAEATSDGSASRPHL